ncbi:suppressor protein SRP40-like [Humulus lupulus]|uniref:suppressor protein SRP40-like n=1 Tax=Humulus lupulus TaxID=3486 RepID=UPI002B415368|nr:suppressor protein SRP40-like [Humulus lupulus]
MATTKVKRDSSSSSSTTTTATTTYVPGKKTQTSSNSHPRTSSTTSNSTKKAASSSLASTDDTSQKQVPNYLKPTKSSGPTFIKHPKNQDNHTNKPTLNRRRSFDKPPSPSGSFSLAHQKASERVLSNSSSFSSKTTSSPPPPRNLSSSKITAPPRATKPQTLYVKNAKTSKESFVRKEKGSTKSTSSSTTNKVVKPDGTVVKVDHDDQLIKATPPDDDHELIKSEDNVSHDDHGSDVVDYEHDPDIDHEINKLSPPCDISTVSDELVVKADHHDDPEVVNYDNNNNSNDGIEEKPDKLDSTDQEVEDIDPGDEHDSDQLLLEDGQENMNQNKLADHQDLEGTNNIIAGDDHRESKADDDQIVLVKEKDTNKANVEKVTTATNQETGSVNIEENKFINIICDDHDHDHVDHHLKEQEHAVEEVAKPVGASPALVPVAAAAVKRQGKKESQAYNDVIEETARKLLEKRKNKVKALVGAFETVIDYESK